MDWRRERFDEGFGIFRWGGVLVRVSVLERCILVGGGFVFFRGGRRSIIEKGDLWRGRGAFFFDFSKVFFCFVDTERING